MAISTNRAVSSSCRPADLEPDTTAQRTGTGDICAFDELVARHQQHITQLAYRLLGWRDQDVDDLVQDVFLAAFKNLDKFRGQCSLKSWLTRIAVNRCRTWHRKRMFRIKLHKSAAQNQPITHRPPSTPDADLLSQETFAQVRRVVQALPQKFREVVVLRYLEEMPVPEVAQILDLTTNMVNVRLSRARQKLKEKLDYLKKT